MVPNYLILNYLGLIDSFLGLILPSIFGAFGVFLLRQSMMGINDSYLESALLDGAPLRKIFVRIVMPMVKPTVATLVLLNFMGQWNSYLWPLLILQSPEKTNLAGGFGNHVKPLRRETNMYRWPGRYYQ